MEEGTLPWNNLANNTNNTKFMLEAIGAKALNMATGTELKIIMMSPLKPWNMKEKRRHKWMNNGPSFFHVYLYN